MCACVCISMCVITLVGRSEDKLVKLVLPFCFYMGSGTEPRSPGLHNNICPLSLLASPAPLSTGIRDVAGFCCCGELNPGSMRAKQASLNCLPHLPSACFGALYSHYCPSYHSGHVGILYLFVRLDECIIVSLGDSCCPEAPHSTVEVCNSPEGSLGTGDI